MQDQNLNNEFVDTNEPGIYLDENDQPYVLLEDGSTLDIVDAYDNTVVLAEPGNDDEFLVMDVDTGEQVLLWETDYNGEPEINLAELDSGEYASVVLSEYGNFISIDTPEETGLLFYDGEETYDLTEHAIALSELGVDIENITLSELLEGSIQLEEAIATGALDEVEDTVALHDNTQNDNYEHAYVQLSEQTNNMIQQYESIIDQLNNKVQELEAKMNTIEDAAAIQQQNIILSELEALVNKWTTPDAYGRIKLLPAEKEKTLKLMASMNEVQLSEYIDMIENRPSIQLSEIGTSDYTFEEDEENIKLSEVNRLAAKYEKQGYSPVEAFTKAHKEIEGV